MGLLYLSINVSYFEHCYFSPSVMLHSHFLIFPFFVIEIGLEHHNQTLDFILVFCCVLYIFILVHIRDWLTGVLIRP